MDSAKYVTRRNVTRWAHRVEKRGGSSVAPIMSTTTVQICGGGSYMICGAMIWGCCSWSGQGSATPCVQRMRSPDYLNIMTNQEPDSRNIPMKTFLLNFHFIKS